MKRSTTRTNMCNTEIKAMNKSENVKDLAIQTARNELADSVKNLMIANSAVKATNIMSADAETKLKDLIKAKADLVLNSKEYDEMTKKFVKAPAELNLHTDVLDEILEEALLSDREVDKEAIFQTQVVDTLTSLIQMNAGLLMCSVFDRSIGLPVSEHEIKFRNLIKGVVLGHMCSAKWVTPHAYILGGKEGHVVVNGVDSISVDVDAMVDVVAVRETTKAMALELAGEEYKTIKDSSVINLDNFGITIELFPAKGATAAIKATLTWNEFFTKARLLNRIVMVGVKGKDGEREAIFASRNLNSFRRIAALHLSGVELNGLKDDPTAMAVINVGAKISKTGLTAAQVIKTPFQGLVANGYMSEDNLAISNLLTAAGYKPVLNAEQYAAQGYVTKGAYVTKANAFCDEHGNSYEDAAKLLARLQKLALNRSQYSVMAKTVVVAPVMVNTVPANYRVNKLAQSEFNDMLARDLVAGNSVGTPAMNNVIGTVRAVTGSNEGESGQKAVIGLYDEMNTEAVEAVTTALFGANLHTEKVIIAGFGSTKAASFKHHMDGYELVQAEFKGKAVVFARKEVVEEYKITDSYTAFNYEIVEQGKLSSVEAATDRLARRVFGRKNVTIMDMLYSQEANDAATVFLGEDFNIVDRVKMLLDSGVIREKSLKNKTNSQLNAGLEFQFGRELAESVLEFLVTQNHSEEYRHNVFAALNIAANRTDGIATIDGKALIGKVAEIMTEYGSTNVDSSVWNISVVNHLAEQLKSANSLLVTLDFGYNNQVTVPVNNNVLNSVERIGRNFDVRVSGLMADILASIAHAVKQALKGKLTLSEKAGAIIVEKIAVARDRAFSKKLNQIPTIGTNVALITSGKLTDNELVSARVQAAERKASGTYAERVIGLITKPPVLWMGSISAIKLIRKDFSEAKRILMGASAYISPEKALGNGNDADGDRIAVDFVAERIVASEPRLHPDYYIDARDENVAVGGRFYSNFWKEELEGMTLNKANASKLDKFKVTTEEFEEAMVKSVFQAAYAKANVAIYTTHGSDVMNYKDVWLNAAKEAITKGHDLFNGKMSSYLADIRGSEVKMDAVINALHTVVVDTANACVNFDAMDQVKDEAGRNVKKLAELIAPTALAKFDSKFIQYVNEGQTFESASNGVITKRFADVAAVMFKEKGHNISLASIENVLPVDVKDMYVRLFVAFVIVKANMAVGVAKRTTFNQFLTVTGKYKDDLSLEALLAEKESDGYTTNDGVVHKRTMLSVRSAASFILSTAYKNAKTTLVEAVL